MDWIADFRARLMTPEGVPRYEVIAAAMEEAIATGRLRPGERLPTVRQLAHLLAVSDTTVVAAYGLLKRRGWTHGEVGRGTFVTAVPRSHQPVAETGGHSHNGRRHPAASNGLAVAWRRRALITTTTNLRALSDQALDGTWAEADPALLPIAILRRAWTAAMDATMPADLQYPRTGGGTIAAFVSALVPHLLADGIPAREVDILLGSSVQHLTLLTLDAISRLEASARLVVAVEEPGHFTFLDAFEQAGYGLVGVEVDQHGAIPASLDAALAAGATVALLTPRVHNPTGVSWSPARGLALADVLAGHPDAVVIEDDYFAGMTAARPGSLLADPRLQDRVVYLRSFSKALAPDLRLVAAVVRPRLRPLLTAAMQRFGASWHPQLLQRVVAYALSDPDLERVLAAAGQAYRTRRAAAIQALTAGLAGVSGSVAAGDDGLSLWVWLPADVDAAHVVGQAASLGLLAGSGESFFIQPGRSDGIRLCVGTMTTEQAALAGQLLATAIRTAPQLAMSLPLT